MSLNFVNVKDFYKYHTRFSEHNFIIPDCQDPKSHTFYHSAMEDWNSLPKKLKTILHNKKLKLELKKILQLHNQSRLRMKLYTCIILTDGHSAIYVEIEMHFFFFIYKMLLIIKSIETGNIGTKVCIPLWTPLEIGLWAFMGYRWVINHHFVIIS